MGDIINSQLQVVPESVFEGKLVVLFFGSFWCPMVMTFLPTLREFYGNHKNEIEILYVSSDVNKESYEEFVKSCPWFALSFGSMATSGFKQKHRVWSGKEHKDYEGRSFGNSIFYCYRVTGVERRSGIPALVVLDENKEEVAFISEDVYDKSVEELEKIWHDSKIFSLTVKP